MYLKRQLLALCVFQKENHTNIPARMKCQGPLNKNELDRLHLNAFKMPLSLLAMNQQLTWQSKNIR